MVVQQVLYESVHVKVQSRDIHRNSDSWLLRLKGLGIEGMTDEVYGFLLEEMSMF